MVAPDGEAATGLHPRPTVTDPQKSGRSGKAEKHQCTQPDRAGPEAARMVASDGEAAVESHPLPTVTGLPGISKIAPKGGP